MTPNLTIPLPPKQFKDYQGDNPKGSISLPKEDKVEIGDIIQLVEIDGDKLKTGEELFFEVTYIIGDPQRKGWLSVGIKKAAPEDAALSNTNP